MRMTLLGRLAVAAGAAALAGLGVAAPAMADTTVAINPGNVPTTAAGYGKSDCDFGGGPYAGKDVWVFVLPGNPKKVGDFVSVTATFGANGTVTIPADGGAVVTDRGASKAWITTPAGWTLTGATAVVSGTATKFNLTHTCPAAGGGETPKPTPKPTASASASPTPTGGTHGGGSGSGAGSGSGGGSGNGGGSAAGSLPVTGTAVTGIVLTGVALVIGGVLLLVARRRRDTLAFSADESQ